jgi:hypothetical protein
VKICRPLAIFLLLLATNGARAAPIDAWAGTYTYETIPGKVAGGVTAMVDIALMIWPDGRCELTLQGYQTDESIQCAVTADPGHADILFRTYSDGQIRNAYGVEEYRPGQRLVSLLRDPKRGGELVTTWDGLVPDGSRERRGHFFQRKW